MNDSSDDYEELQSTNLTQNKADGQTPGEILREARLANDYSVEDLCAQTKLSAKTVHALEDNDFDALSQPVFARGYYRQCAKVLGIDSDRLMAAYGASGGASSPRAMGAPTFVNVVPQDVTPGRWRSLGLIVAVLVLLVAIGAIFLLMPSAQLPDENSGSGNNTVVLSSDSSAGSGSADTGTDAASSTSTPDVAGNDADSDDSGQASVSGQRQGGRNVNETLGLNPNANTPDNAAQAAPAEPQVDPNHLTVNFTDRSWVDIRDANGARLLTGIYEAGEKRDFDGTPPYKITLGFAPGVKLSIGGEPVDVAAQTTGNSTARLTVAARSDN
ncbi:helix-turn-helix domain-containing protein [Salinisphaera aquimarina]|uniref:Helix-turn-helix domain-containing protein n=1 Tax=Salinisphaera aquimarina TaxID=2094031 RepID=A0ABV7EWM0_9GAMM